MQKLYEILLEKKILSEDQLKRASENTLSKHSFLAEELLQSQMLKEEELIQALRLSTPYAVLADLNPSQISPAVKRTISPQLIESKHVIPLEISEHKIHVAFLDPSDQAIVQEIQGDVGMEIVPVICPYSVLVKGLSDLYQIKLAALKEGETEVLAPKGAPVRVSEVSKKAAAEWPEGFSIPSTPPEETLTAAEKVETAKEISLSELKHKFKTASQKEEIAEVSLEFLRQYFFKGAIFIIQEGNATGWRGFGGSFDTPALRRVKLALESPSIFERVWSTASPYIGDVFHSQLNDSFVKALEDFPPKEVALFPLKIGQKIFGFLYLEISSEKEKQIAAREVPNLCALIEEGFTKLIQEIRQKKAA